MFFLNKRKLTFLLGSTSLIAIVQFLQTIFTGYFYNLTNLGSLAIIQLVLNFSIAFSDAGVLNLVIQRKKLSSKFLNDLMAFLTLFIFVYSIAYSIIIYFFQNNFEVFNGIHISLIWLVPGIIISMLTTFYYNYIIRFSEYKHSSSVDFLTISIQVVFFILFSYLGFGVESLVYAWYLSIAFKCLYLKKHIKIPYSLKVKVSFQSKKYLRFLLHYQFYQLTERIVNMFATQFDMIVVSSLFSKEIFGAYSFIKTIVLKVIQLISMLIHKTLFPSLVEIKRKSIGRYNNLLKNFNYLIHIGVVLIGGNFILSLIVLKIYGQKFYEYNYVVYYLQFQALYVYLVTLATSFMLVENKVKFITYLNFIGILSMGLSVTLLHIFNFTFKDLLAINIFFEFIFISFFLFKIGLVKFQRLMFAFMSILLTFYLDFKIVALLLLLLFITYSLYSAYHKKNILFKFFNYV